MITKQVRFHRPQNAQLDIFELEPLKDNQICCKTLKSVISAGNVLIFGQGIFGAACTHGVLPECVIDATANYESFSHACELTRNGGDLSLIADPPTPSKQHFGYNILIGYLNIHGIYIRMQTQTPNAFAPETIFDVLREICS